MFSSKYSQKFTTYLISPCISTPTWGATPSSLTTISLLFRTFTLNFLLAYTLLNSAANSWSCSAYSVSSTVLSAKSIWLRSHCLSSLSHIVSFSLLPFWKLTYHSVHSYFTHAWRHLTPLPTSQCSHWNNNINVQSPWHMHYSLHINFYAAQNFFFSSMDLK